MFQGLDYVPLLHARLAEIRALEGLGSATKQRMFPVVRVRPWFNAGTIQRAYDVIESAVGEAFYGFDLDPTKLDLGSEKPAIQEFSRLFLPTHGYEKYYETVSEGQFRVPVFRSLAAQNPQISLELSHVEQIGRGLIVRIPIAAPGAYIQIAQQCLSRGINNTAFIFDCGWRQDVLQQVAITAGLVNSLLDVSDDLEISVAASTFPDDFSKKGLKFSKRITEREYFEEVRSLVNRGNLTYGDWGSTREPSDGGFARSVPRIDMADQFNWMFWRSDGNETYQDVCRRVIQDDLWDGNLDAWGKFLIQSTAVSDGTVIQSSVMAAAVRVNLHLIAQAHRNDPAGYQTPDTPVGSVF